MSVRTTLGIDLSTQSVTGVVLRDHAVVTEVSIAYRNDLRMARFGIDFMSMIVPPRVPGEADQPPLMFLAALDVLFMELARREAPLDKLDAIAVSAQQHGHVYLSGDAYAAFHALQGDRTKSLAGQFEDVFAYGTAPIWRTSNTAAEAAHIRTAVGGREAMIRLSGSNSPLRFTGAIIRRIATRHPRCYVNTARIHLLSSFASGVLTGNADCAIDWGNGAGTSLMDYTHHRWSDELLAAVGADLPGGVAELRRKLPRLASPTDVAGTIAPYFTRYYDVPKDCVIAVGSGDNPQSKVLTHGDVLSLGTSFVYMVATKTPIVDVEGYANSMYDGIGRPFVFACRSNGALVWDRLREIFGAAEDFARSAQALAAADPRATVAIWQPYMESYPLAPPLPHREIERGEGSFERWYPAVVDSALILTYAFARGFAGDSTAPLAVTGGPSADPNILARIAAIWRRPVVPVTCGGAALGGALSALAAIGCDARRLDRIRRDLVVTGKRVVPDRRLVDAFHGPDGAIDAVVATFHDLLNCDDARS